MNLCLYCQIFEPHFCAGPFKSHPTGILPLFRTAASRELFHIYGPNGPIAQQRHRKKVCRAILQCPVMLNWSVNTVGSNTGLRLYLWSLPWTAFSQASASRLIC